jgi:uncharacterized protein
MSSIHSVHDGPFVINCHDLPRRAGEMREYGLTITEHESMGLPFFAIPLGEAIEVSLRLSAVSEGVLASAAVRAVAVGECTRCLDRIELDLDEEFNELYIYEPDPRSRSTRRHEKEIIVEDEDEVRTMHGDYIDLEGPIRDALILNLPVNPLCSEDCLGLCPECGIKWIDLPEDHGHEQIDTRWAGLEKLKNLDGLDDQSGADGSQR